MPQSWNEHLDGESARLSLGAASLFDLNKAFKKISFPFLIMTGDYDPNLTSSRDMINNSDKGDLRVLENVGHGSVLQRPDLTLENFLDWHGK
jgi:pimeloyl-ACP methyl ester carboxylesterase